MKFLFMVLILPLIVSCSSTSTPQILPTPTSTPSPSATPTPVPPTATVQVGSLASPAPFHMRVVTTDAWSDIQVGLTIQQVIRGYEAWNRLMLNTGYDYQPKGGTEWILVKVRVEHLGSAGVLEMGDFDWSLAANNQLFRSYISVLGILPYNDIPPLDDIRLLPGGSADRWLAFQVPLSELSPQIVYAETTFFATE